MAFAPAAGDLAFLKELTEAVVRASRVEPGTRVGGSPTNTCGFPLIMPGGRGGYPAFWIRDFAMSLDCGVISAGDISNHLFLVARCQNRPEPRKLQRGLEIPPFAVPDHINFDGGAVFYPGTYASGDDQGDGAYGFLPPVDDHYEFVHIAYRLFRATANTRFLENQVEGRSLLERLERAFEAPQVDAATGLVVTDAARRAVGFGFCDAIYLTGKLLFPSLLRYRAAGELAELHAARGAAARARAFRDEQAKIARHLGVAFAGTGSARGWLLGATEIGRQPDVWGTAYALHLGLLQPEVAREARRVLAAGIRKGTLVYEGAVRHVPTDADFSAESAWERTVGVKVNTYQNGAYWHTPTGWLIEALAPEAPEAAAEVFGQFMAHLRKGDFRVASTHQAPWECFGPGNYAQNGVYMTSVTLPCAVLQDLARN